MTKPKRPTIAITGASGFLGSRLVEHFSGLGWQVVGLVRHQVSSHTLNVSYRKYDMEKVPDGHLLDGVDYLVHAAFVAFDAKHPDAGTVNIKAAERLAALSNQLKWRVFISSMSAHDEAISVYGTQKLAIEKIFSGPHDTVLRPGLIIGGEGIVKRMTAFMTSKHVVPLIGSGQQPLQIIAVSDLALMIETVINRKQAGCFTAANPTVYTYKQFYQLLAAHLHVKVFFVPVPYHGLLFLFRVAGLLKLPLAVGEDNLKGLRQLRSADNAQELKKLGIKLKDLPAALCDS